MVRDTTNRQGFTLEVVTTVGHAVSRLPGLARPARLARPMVNEMFDWDGAAALT
jgi:hypothetical protein